MTMRVTFFYPTNTCCCSAASTIIATAAATTLILFQYFTFVSSFSPPSVVLWKGKTISSLSIPTTYRYSSYTSIYSSSAADEEDDSISDSIDINVDPRLVRVRLPRALGIDWGTDLSFSFVYVRDLEAPTGAAFLSGEVNIGDQICELRPVVNDPTKKIEDTPAINLIGASFDEVMGTFASMGRDIRDVDIVFFRGTKDELKAACAGGGKMLSNDDGKDKITISVIQKNSDGTTTRQEIEARTGCNVRQVLTDNGINVYQSLTRWTNCKGKQLCGTCIVNITEGSSGTNRKSLDESSTLRENPDSYRLSCVTFAYADVTVETFPPIKAAQWTR